MKRSAAIRPGTTRPDRGCPEAVFELLSERRELAPGTAVFEVGPGTGSATGPLLERGAKPPVAVEPDARMARFLRRRIPDPALKIVVAPFETADLGRADFDLGVSATAFHWLDEDVALPKVAALLRPGGWWALMWNVFGFPGAADPFHEATKADRAALPRVWAMSGTRSTRRRGWRRWRAPAPSRPPNTG